MPASLPSAVWHRIFQLSSSRSVAALALVDKYIYALVNERRRQYIRITTLQRLDQFQSTLTGVPTIGTYVLSLHLVNIRVSFFESDSLDSNWFSVLLTACPLLENLRIQNIDFWTSECIDIYCHNMSLLADDNYNEKRPATSLTEKRRMKHVNTPRLTSLAISQCDNVSGRALRRFFTHLFTPQNDNAHHIRYLCLSKLAATSFEDLNILIQLALSRYCVTHLDLSFNSHRINDNTLGLVTELCPKLSFLSVAGDLLLSAAALSTITAALPVISIDFSNCIQLTTKDLPGLLLSTNKLHHSTHHVNNTDRKQNYEAPPYTLVDHCTFPIACYQKLSVLNIAHCSRIRITDLTSGAANALRQCTSLSELTIHYGDLDCDESNSYFNTPYNNSHPVQKNYESNLPSYIAIKTDGTVSNSSLVPLQLSCDVLRTLSLVHLTIDDANDGVPISVITTIAGSCKTLYSITVCTKYKIRRDPYASMGQSIPTCPMVNGNNDLKSDDLVDPFTAPLFNDIYSGSKGKWRCKLFVNDVVDKGVW